MQQSPFRGLDAELQSLLGRKAGPARARTLPTPGRALATPERGLLEVRPAGGGLPRREITID